MPVIWLPYAASIFTNTKLCIIGTRLIADEPIFKATSSCSSPYIAAAAAAALLKKTTKELFLAPG